MAKLPLIIANWKMCGSRAAVEHWLAEVQAADVAVTRVLCPAMPYVALAAGLTKGVGIGSQDCHYEKEGAHTGDVSASMLKEQGCVYAIVGHSERRAAYGETDAIVARKAAAVLAAGLTPIICVGESWHERQAGMAVATVGESVNAVLTHLWSQRLAGSIVIAYEPIWAIGTGKVPTVADIKEMHQAITQTVAQHFKAFAPALRVVYGGSVKPENAAEIAAVPGVDGFLVGGASLKPESYTAICMAALPVR